ncbi:ABC transporter substrate-binding protein [Miniphocaeibacter halophilus]|uniref:ABC transporter substrate-binding protein n=1 Tax=Miniphocaeibacter halophilus TaxID=2931922 RepID=A0AC61MSI7_9FIRM|nr:ABC transporter substrate-binding protein [Miniphocaeibacter halophilus]QQK08589.1 ABC transporter substrate-binding protein [Miniphocaeibacter halophilus]
MKNFRKKLSLLSLLLVFVIAVTACSNNGGNKPTSEIKETDKTKVTEETQKTDSSYSFKFAEKGKVIDSIGREVQLPEKITKIAVAGNPAQMMMFTIAPEMLVGWGSEPSESLKKYLPDDLVNLPVIGTFYGKNASMNYEEMIKAEPDVIIDVGEVKESMKEDLDGLQEQTNIPVIFVECMLENTADAYRTLGKLLDKEEGTNEQAEYIEKTLEDVKEKRETIKDKITVYYGRGDSGLQTNSEGSIHAEVINFIGAENVYKDDSKSSPSWEEVSMEQIAVWNPNIIMFLNDSIYDTVGNDPVWKDLQAIKDNKYYEAPGEPYDWLGSPPNANRIIGIKWLGNLVYPDIYKYDMVKETKEFYKLFYHSDLTDEQVKELLAKSTFK